MNRLPFLYVVSVALLPLLDPHAALAAESEPAPSTPAAAELAEVLQRMADAQKKLETMTASFTQEKTMELLAEPSVSRGKLTYEAPSRILWEYEEPDRTVLLIDERTLLAYYPDLKKADRLDIAEKRSRYDRYFGLAFGAQGPLQEYFEAELARESEIPATKLVVLTPKSKRVEKYLVEIRLWVDEASFLPRRFEYREENGDTTAYSLDDVVTNRPLPADRFVVNLPPDVEVTEVSDGMKSRRGDGKL